MSYETLDPWEGEVPQGHLKVFFQRAGDIKSAHEAMQDERFRFHVTVASADSWGMSISHVFHWSLYTPRCAWRPEAQELQEGFQQLLEPLGGFYERVLTQAQKDGVGPLEHRAGDVDIVTAQRHYHLRGEGEVPTLDRLQWFMLRACVSSGVDEQIPGFKQWFSNPPQITDPGELFYTLTAPERAYLMPWHHIFYHANYTLLKSFVAERTLTDERNRDFFHRLAAVVSLAEDGDALRLAGATLEDASVALESWELLALLKRNFAATLVEGDRQTSNFSIK